MIDANGNDNTPEWGYCQTEGCKEPAIPCYLSGSGPPDEPDDLLCAEHCTDEGYCWGCGNFWAGIETFDFSPDGLCENCGPEIRESEDYDEADYWWEIL